MGPAKKEEKKKKRKRKVTTGGIEPRQKEKIEKTFFFTRSLNARTHPYLSTDQPTFGADFVTMY